MATQERITVERASELLFKAGIHSDYDLGYVREVGPVDLGGGVFLTFLNDQDHPEGFYLVRITLAG